MKKRFSSLTLIGVAALLLTLIGAISAMAAPAASVDGTTTLDQQWYKTGATVTVTVTDADFSSISADAVFTTTVTTASNGAGQFLQLLMPDGVMNVSNGAGSPVVALTSTNARANALPSTQASFSYTNAAQGKGTLFTSGVPGGIGTTVWVVYNTGAIGTVGNGGIKVTSTNDSVGIFITGTESGIQTGVFKGTFTVSNSPSAGTSLLAQDGATIQVAYTDTAANGTSVQRTAIAHVDAEAPTITGLAPVNNSSTATDPPTFSGTIGDTGGSGIQVSSVALAIDGGGFINSPALSTSSDGASSLTFTFTPSAALGAPATNIAHTWKVTAKDMAGNSVTSATMTLNINKVPPTLNNARTGRFWDTSTTTPNEGKNRTTSVVVRFSGALDPTSVNASAFTVGGATPVGAMVNPAQAVGPGGVDGGYVATGTVVYLTLGTTLGPSDQPVVALVGTVKDVAGNALTAPPSVTAGDGIAPSFTVTPSTTAVQAGTKITVTVTSNEAVQGVPTLTVYDKTGVLAATYATPTIVTSTSWNYVISSGTGVPDTVDSKATNKNTIKVTGLDLAGNSGSKGTPNNADASAIAFVNDGTVPTTGGAGTWFAGGVDISATVAGVTPIGTAPNVPSSNPFVTVAYSEAVKVTTALFGAKGSTLADVTANTQLSSDGKTVSYAALGLTVGTIYNFRISAKDLVGNAQNDMAGQFAVIALPIVKIPLAPGMNLVSLPSDPSDTGINTVMAGTSATSVITYDPLNPSTSTGPWLTATRGADGKFTGNLTTIDSKHAYWVNSTSFIPISANIPTAGFAVTPPAMPVVAGWNLVPVVSLIGQAPGTLISADQYFASLPGWVTAYTFNPQTNAWTKITPKNFQNVTVGNGYWLYVSAAGILVP